MRRPTLTPLDRRIVTLALPALGALVVEPLYTLTDTAIVGHLGRAPLAGLALASTVLNLVGWTSNFLGMATTSRVAQRRGQRDDRGVAAAVTAAYAAALAAGAAVAVLVAVAGPPVAHLLGGTGATQHNATTYLQISAVGMPALLVTLAGTGHLTGSEDTRTPLRIVLVANALNLALEVALVYGAGLGVAGSAWGTVAAQVVAAALFLRASQRKVPRPIRPPRAEFVLLAHSGAALIVRTVALGSALVAATAVAARVGTATLAGHQIALQVWLLLALTLDALAVPAQVYVSTALGAGDAATARAVGRRCLQIGLVVSAVVGAATAAAATVLPAAFTTDADVSAVATVALLWCAALQPFAACAFVYDGLLLGAGDFAGLRTAMLLALVAFAPLATATALDHRLGISGIWAALTCWLAARTVLLARRWQRQRWAVTPG